MCVYVCCVYVCIYIESVYKHRHINMDVSSSKYTYPGYRSIIANTSTRKNPTTYGRWLRCGGEEGCYRGRRWNVPGILVQYPGTLFDISPTLDTSATIVSYWVAVITPPAGCVRRLYVRWDGVGRSVGAKQRGGAKGRGKGDLNVLWIRIVDGPFHRSPVYNHRLSGGG